MAAKVVNTSLLGYPSAARRGGRRERGERWKEREGGGDFPQQAQCGVGISGSVVRAAPPLKHREGQSVRGKTSGAAEGAQERADSSRRWTGGGGGGGGGGSGAQQRRVGG